GNEAGSALDEGALDHIMSEITLPGLDKSALVKNLAGIFQHAWASTHHEAIALEIESRQTNVTEQLTAFHEICEASFVVIRFSSHCGVVDELILDQVTKKL